MTSKDERSFEMKHSPRKHRLFIALTVVTLVSMIGVSAAEAHVSVVSRSPRPGSTVSKSLRTVKITFSGQIRSGTLKVYNANGVKVSIGTGGRDPRNVRRLVTTLKTGLRAGRYTARWTCTAADGHRESGYWRFRLS
jgi:methionine-rich copper-binding protein CopC